MATSSPTSLREAWVALSGLAAVFLFEMLDNSILNVALPTIGRDLHASTTGLQWVTGAYTVVFGGLMLVFGALADRYGRRRTMLVGLTMLALASFVTAFVNTTAELIAVRCVMGIAAAMTTPGSMALVFSLFTEDNIRIRAITVITTVGLIGLAIGPTVGGLVLAVAPWQVLLLANVPIAILAGIGIGYGIAKDDRAEFHRDPIDFVGGFLGTATIVCALVAPTLFINQGTSSWAPWTLTGVAVLGAVLFIIREVTAEHPLLDLKLVAHPLVSSGLAFNCSTGLATAGLGYLVTLQMQLGWHWSPAHAAVALLPQVVVLIASGPFVEPFVEKVGMTKAAWVSATLVVVGLAVYGFLNHFGYIFVITGVVLEAIGMRVIGPVAGNNILRGLPKNRTSVGAALNDTSSEVTSAIGVAIAGSIIATIFTGTLAAGHFSSHQASQFQTSLTTSGLTLTVLAAVFVVAGYVLGRGSEAVEESEAA